MVIPAPSSPRPAGPAGRIHGILTPHMVPLAADGSIDEPELRRYVEWLIASGVHGLYPNGSTGEFTRFTAEERRRVIRIVCEQAAGRVTEAFALHYRLLDLFDRIFAAGDFPEGFRLAAGLRGFTFGPGRQPLSATQREKLAAAADGIAERIDAVLAELGLAR